MRRRRFAIGWSFAGAHPVPQGLLDDKSGFLQLEGRLWQTAYPGDMTAIRPATGGSDMTKYLEGTWEVGGLDQRNDRIGFPLAHPPSGHLR